MRKREEERIRFLVERKVVFFYCNTCKNSAIACRKKRLTLQPKLLYDIYRPSLRIAKWETLTRHVPSHGRIFHAQNFPFCCFPDYTQYLINWVIKREYYLSLLVMKNSATLVQGCCRIFVKGKSTI